MKVENFNDLYTKLNPAQKEAVDSVEGPVMVIAGPGTGKTRILTLRIANILKITHANPENIVALTFTESGAMEMRRRLAELIGPQVYRIMIGTFHGFCNDILQMYPDSFPLLLGRRAADEAVQIGLIRDVVQKIGTNEGYKPFGKPFHHVAGIKAAISDLKREGFSPDDFCETLAKQKERVMASSDLYHEKGAHAGKMKAVYEKELERIGKHYELAAMYEAYQKALDTFGFYDYDDMILEVLHGLESNELLLRLLQEQYQYFLVDEHQDTNTAQNKIIDKLASFYAEPNLFVVGDAKQAIFRFQGASLENFLYFKKRYPNAKFITLNENYRSTQHILDASFGVVQHNSQNITDVLTELSEKLEARAGHNEKMVSVCSFDKHEDELYFIGQEIKRLAAAGVMPREIAVIYRDNKEAYPVSDMFDRLSILYTIESKRNVLEDLDIKKLIALFQLLDASCDDAKLATVLYLDLFAISPLTVFELTKAARENRIPLLKAITSRDLVKAIAPDDAEKILEIGKKILGWQTIAKNETALTVFEVLVRESGFIEKIMRHADSATRLARVNTFFAEFKKMSEAKPALTLHDALERLAIYEEHNVAVKESIGVRSDAAVRLMTAHGSKGLEFDYVFIINAFDGHWGNKRSVDAIKLSLGGGAVHEEKVLKLDDERRLFYVALTRAKKGAFITYPRRRSDGKECVPSQFIAEMPTENISFDDVATVPENMLPKDAYFTSYKKQGVSLFDPTLLKTMFYERGISATALNQFMTCPWTYLYRTLLFMPQTQTKHQAYGTAVHYAMRALYDAINNKKQTKEAFLEAFEFMLARQPLTKEEFEEAKKKGLETLTAYYDFYECTWHKDLRTKNEFKIKDAILPKRGDLEQDLLLTGSLDKIVYSPDSDNVTVVDYKTGKAKSRNEIEGKTQTGNGDYKRQLVFYKILTSNSESFKENMTTGVLDFVEPDDKGKFKQESFLITEDEVAEVKEQIYTMAEAVTTGAFIGTHCEDEKCLYCWLSTLAEKEQ